MFLVHINDKTMSVVTDLGRSLRTPKGARVLT